MLRKSLKRMLSLLVAGGLALALAGCGDKQDDLSDSGSKENAEKSEITFANFNASGGNEETLQKMYQAFQEEYPNIKVNIETIGYDDYFTQMQTRVAGGTAPDCYELNIENFAAYSAKGILAEIEVTDTKAINQTALDAFKVDQKQYGLPGSFSNVVLIYNKALFDQAGIDYPVDDWTWEDAQKAAEAIHKLGDDIYGIYAPVTYNEFFKVAAQYGGSLLDEDKTAFTINSEENRKAADMMVGRVTGTNVQPTLEQMGGMGDWDLFESGRLGMITTGIWAFQPFQESCDFEWDICVEPGGTNKATHFFSNAYVINGSSKNTEAAATWINWLASSDKAAEIRIEAGWDLPAITDQNALSEYLKQSDPANRQAVFDSLDYLVTPPIIEEYSLMSDIINKKLEESASGKITVEEALNQAQSECEAQITLK